MSVPLKVFTVFILIASLCIASETSAERVANILKINGQVRIFRDGRTVKPQFGMNLLGGDLIITGGDGHLSIKLIGNHVVEVMPDSEYQLDEAGIEKETLVSSMLYTGLVYARKRPSGKEEKKIGFQVQTPSAVAGVRGTSLAVAVASDGSVRVGVEEGSVEVETDDEKIVNLGLREGVEIDPIGRTAVTSEYLPEETDFRKWLGEKRKKVLKNPVPSARRLVLNLNKMLAVAENVADETLKLAEKILDESRTAEANRMRGQAETYSYHKSNVRKAMPALIRRVRFLIRIDNRIQARGRMLDRLVREATAEGSTTPARAVAILKKHKETFAKINDRAMEIHRKRVVLLREKIPELKVAAKYVR